MTADTLMTRSKVEIKMMEERKNFDDNSKVVNEKMSDDNNGDGDQVASEMFFRKKAGKKSLLASHSRTRGWSAS